MGKNCFGRWNSFFVYLFKLKFIWQMAHVSPSNLTRIEIFSNVLICQVRTVDGAIEIWIWFVMKGDILMKCEMKQGKWLFNRTNRKLNSPERFLIFKSNIIPFAFYHLDSKVIFFSTTNLKWNFMFRKSSFESVALVTFTKNSI